MLIECIVALSFSPGELDEEGNNACFGVSGPHIVNLEKSPKIATLQVSFKDMSRYLTAP